MCVIYPHTCVYPCVSYTHRRVCMHVSYTRARHVCEYVHTFEHACTYTHVSRECAFFFFSLIFPILFWVPHTQLGSMLKFVSPKAPLSLPLDSGFFFIAAHVSFLWLTNMHLTTCTWWSVSVSVSLSVSLSVSVCRC